MTCRGPSPVPTPTSRGTPGTRRCNNWWRTTRASTTWAATSPTTRSVRMKWGPRLGKSKTRKYRQQTRFVFVWRCIQTATSQLSPPEYSLVSSDCISCFLPGLLPERSGARHVGRLQQQCGAHGGGAATLPAGVRPLSGRLWRHQPALTRHRLLHTHSRFLHSIY